MKFHFSLRPDEVKLWLGESWSYNNKCSVVENLPTAYVSIYFSYELNAIKNVTSSTGIHTFT